MHIIVLPEDPADVFPAVIEMAGDIGYILDGLEMLIHIFPQAADTAGDISWNRWTWPVIWRSTGQPDFSLKMPCRFCTGTA